MEVDQLLRVDALELVEGLLEVGGRIVALADEHELVDELVVGELVGDHSDAHLEFVLAPGEGVDLVQLLELGELGHVHQTHLQLVVIVLNN